MRTGAIQSNAFPSNEKENLAAKPEFIPKEAIRISEDLRDPMVRDENGKLSHAKAILKKNGDQYGEDRVSVEKPDLNSGAPIADENVMPG